MPCSSTLKAMPTGGSNFLGIAHSNQITCPQATADEASWYQTVFSCNAIAPNPNNYINQFGVPVLLPPVPGDFTGRSVNPDLWCN
jgi:hypothetical protein